MSNYLILLPILNDKVVTFRGANWSLARDAIVRTISEDHYAASHKFGHNLEEIITVKTKCVQFDGFSQIPTEHEVRKHVLCTSYALAHFASDLPPAFRYAIVLLRAANKARVTQLYEVPEAVSGAPLQSEEYKLKPAIKSGEVAALYDVCLRAYERHRLIETTIERYFSGRAKKMFPDKVIDTAIALETLIPGETELKYRFSLYHSLLSSDLPDRDETFRLFSLLYDTRSAIVHGDGARSTRLISRLRPRWSEIVDRMNRALFYYFVFLNQREAADWRDHLHRLALGHPDKLTSSELH